MAARKCPYCLTSVGPIEMVTHSYNLVCRGCDRPLEISRISRNIATFVALVAATLVWYGAYNGASAHQAIGWVLPTLYSVVVFGVIAALMLMTMGDLSLKAGEDVPHAAHGDADVAHVAAHADHVDDQPAGHGTH